MTNFKVLVDTNVLVSASINQLIIKLNCNIKHHFYDLSQPLFEYFRKNIDKRIGIFTPEIENSAKEILIRAIDSEIKDMSNKNIREKLKEIEIYSFILQESTSSLVKNMDILIREPINERAIKQITHQVFAFYNRLTIELRQKDPEKVVNYLTYSLPKNFKKLARGIFTKQQNQELGLYYKLANKFERDPPDIKDVRILSQAIYFFRNKIFGENIQILLASTDHHFSRIRDDKELNDFVPLKIYNELNVYCGWPDEILKILNGEKILDSNNI